MTTLQIISVVILSAGLMFILWRIRSLLLDSIRKDGKAEISLVVRGVTDARQLEQVVRSLMWQRSRIGLASLIIIVDDGMSDEARRMAEIFAEENDYIQITSKREF